MKRYYLILLIFLGACTTQWTKQGFNLRQWQFDDANCNVKATQLYPPQHYTYQLPGYTAPLNTNCSTIGGLVNCSTTGGESYPITHTQDLNENSRRQAWEQCIRSLGYYVVGEQPSANSIKSNPVIEAITIAKSESKSLCERPEFAAFYRKSACDEEDITFSQLSDTSKATSSEKKIITSSRTEEKASESNVLSVMTKYGGKREKAMTSLLKKYLSLTDGNYLRLVQGRINFGEFNKKRQELNIQFDEDIRNLN